MYFTCMQKICTNKSAVEKQERKLIVRHVLKKWVQRMSNWKWAKRSLLYFIWMFCYTVQVCCFKSVFHPGHQGHLACWLSAVLLRPSLVKLGIVEESAQTN